MKVQVTAPNRVDLAGGTTDLYPLYLFMDGGFTVNAAIGLYSRVMLTPLEGSTIRIVSEDLGTSVEVSDPSDLPLDGPLGLPGRIVRAVRPRTGLEIVTRNEAPAGSGLGASSALVVALLKGLLSLNEEEMTARELVALAASIEAASIGVPAGMQDHIAALYGGVSAIEFGYRGFLRTECRCGPRGGEHLEEMLVLSYTGQGRFSGMNNWDVTKGYIDRQPGLREKLIEIRDIARKLGSAVASGMWDEVPLLVDREWAVRRSLAEGISTPKIDAMMSAARKAGAKASKVCGAGGGGCMITLAPPRQRPHVERAITDEGGRVIATTIDHVGVRLSHSD
jgi:D-glycero-alpha-D-manno-heptose-7-phosphate kinase